MWKQLWEDFEARATRLADGGAPVDAVDQTIMWQLLGKTPFVNAPIAAQELHMPELYSGCPWTRSDAPQMKGWVAFVTVNPSIDSEEVFPTRQDVRERGVPLSVSFFENRFEPGPITSPLIHGRNGTKLAVWKNRRSPRGHGQRTWSAIEAALHDCFASTGVTTAAPLGRVAAIMDVVPWKFAKWSAVTRDAKVQLLQLGAPYLAATVQAHPPSVIIAAGADVRQVLRDLYPAGIPRYTANCTQKGTIPIGANAVPTFGVAAPTARGNRFGTEMKDIGRDIRAALGLNQN